ncbi:MAG: hypothetical protein V2J42_11600 [Wenzhouxiangella sp.]|jgi:cell division protein ZapA (FtsZ GTPase activity inhibitor)|nr:hypothetical protein [Wenzhouxiangella sp.]
MSTGDFSFSFAMPAPSPAPRCIARPFQARPIGQETLILAADSEISTRAPMFYAQMLAHCDRLRTLEAHADSVIRHFGLPPDQRAAVQQGLKGLLERGLLQDEQSVYQTLNRDSTLDDVEQPALRLLCVRTCDRPGDLVQLLGSLSRRIENTSLARVLVLDDSRTPQAVAANARAVSETALARHAELLHIDRARRASLIAQLSTEAGVSRPALHWLIEGDDDDSAASYGASLNLALLLSAGERFLMIDDDALIDPYALSAPQDRLSRRVARSTRETQIASSVALMTTTMTGIDNRELLLPVPAKGRGEDLVFGAGIRYLYPGTPCAALPWMLPHRLQSRRRWTAEDLAQKQGAGLAAYLAERMEDLTEATGVTDSDARVGLLAAWMASLGKMHDKERLNDLRRHLLDRRARTADAVSKTLAQLNPPDWLRKEFEVIISGHLQIDAADTQRMATQAPAIGRFASAYGKALPHWSTAWRYVARNGCNPLLTGIA